MKIHPMVKITLLLASMLIMMANAIIAPSLPLINRIFEDIPNAALLTKMMVTIPSLTIAVMAPFAGQLVDRLGRIVILHTSLVIYAIAGTSGLWLDSIWAILGGRFLLGLGVAGVMTAATTMIGDYFTGEARSRFVSLQGTSTALGGLLFISTAGILADINWRLPFSIYAFSVLILLFSLLFLHEPGKKDGPNQGPGEGEQSLRILPLIYGSAFVAMVFFYIIPIQVPFLITSFEGTTNTSTGIAIGMMTLAQAITALFYKRLRKRFNFSSIYALSFLLMAFGFSGLYLSNGYAAIIVSILVTGVGTGWLFPNANLWIISVVPEERRGRLVGILTAFTFFGMFCSPLLIQPVQQWVGLQESFGILVLGLLFFAVIHLVVSFRQLK